MDLFRSEEFTNHVRQLMKQHRVPGLSIAILQDNDIHSTGYGFASISPEEPCTADTLFDIASASKSLTAASVALLVEDDDNYPEVQYDAPMSKLLPGDFVLPDPSYTDGVNVDDVFGHRTGLAPCDMSLMSPRAQQPDDARSVTRNMRNLPIAAPIRSKYMYSDMMYTALTYLVECKTGQRFGDYLQERFFDPLQMTSTNLQPGTTKGKGLEPRMATAYCWDRDNKSFKAFDNPDRPEGQGAGSIITSVNDYIKWVKALMLHESPVTENMCNELIRSRSFLEVEHNEKWLGPFTSQTAAGAGLEMFYYRGYLVVGHNGLVQGFASRHFFLPQFKFGVVIFANSSSAGRIIEIISRELIDAVLGVPVAERHDWSGSISLVDPDGAFERRVKRMDEAVRASFSPDSDESSEKQTLPLDAFVGAYGNKGFHNLTVQIKEGSLFIDASDRSFGFTMTLDHVCDQRKYVAHRSDFFEGGDTPVRAEFIVENGRPVRLGLELEEELEELIWFEKIE